MNEDLLYSPVSEGADGAVEVQLAPNHPGVNDEEYKSRRNSIAAAALRWTPGTPTPDIDYTDSEHDVWRVVCEELESLHAQYACAEYLQGKQELKLPTDRVPQLTEVTQLLSPLTGVTYAAAPGLVPLREFYAALAKRVFHSTQYMRHASEPLYTPEPDVVHEVIGHANQLAFPLFAELTEAAGLATTRLENDDSVKFVADVFWFSLEFGVVRQAGQVRAYGAGILSSFGEMKVFQDMEIRPLHIGQMGTLVYDITKFQPVLFCAASLTELNDVVGGFFASVTDDDVARLRAENPVG